MSKIPVMGDGLPPALLDIAGIGRGCGGVG